MYFFRKPLILRVASSLTRHGHPALSLPQLPLRSPCYAAAAACRLLVGQSSGTSHPFSDLTPILGAHRFLTISPMHAPGSFHSHHQLSEDQLRSYHLLAILDEESQLSLTACSPRPSFCLDKIPLFPAPSCTSLWCVPLSSNCVASRCSGFHLSTFACAVPLVSLSMNQARTDAISLPVFALIPQDFISVALMSHSHPSLGNSYVHV